MVPKKVGGAGQQRGTRKEVSMATLRATTTKGTVTLNPISGILTRPDTYQREGGEGKKAFTQASKQANAMQTTRHPQQRAQKGRP